MGIDYEAERDAVSLLCNYNEGPREWHTLNIL